MSTRHFCTYFDHNYLPRGMVMLESLHEHCPEAHVHVLCLSEECQNALQELDYPHVSLISLQDIEAADSELLAVRPTRSLIEYYFTITPCLPWFLLTKREDIEEVTYLDADMVFFSSPEPIFAEAGDASVIITPHRFSEHLQNRERYGVYNVSWLTFRKTLDGMPCLSWYRDACIDWCRDVLEEDRFADQKYLNYFPKKYSGVHVMRHPGGGVAPWNIEGATIESKEEAILINGVPLIFYHAHGFKQLTGPFFSSGLYDYAAKVSPEQKKYLFIAYINMLYRSKKRVQSLLDIHNFGGIRQKKQENKLDIFKNIYHEYRSKTLITSFFS